MSNLRNLSDLGTFSFSGLYAAMVSLFGGRPREVDDHLKKKTGDRAPNRAHCQAVVVLALDLWANRREDFVAYLRESDVPSPHRLVMAATGRPFKDRKSGKNEGAQEWADRLSTQILTDLAYLAGVTRPDVTYANQRGTEWTQPSPQAKKYPPKELAAPATQPVKGSNKGKGKVS
jgi:hypothetical protein